MSLRFRKACQSALNLKLPITAQRLKLNIITSNAACINTILHICFLCKRELYRHKSEKTSGVLYEFHYFISKCGNINRRIFF